MVLQKFVAMYAAGKVPGLHLKKYPKKPESFRDLDGLCIIYNKLELFNWLNRRFAGNIVEQQTAEMLVERTTKLINEALSVSETLQLSHCYIERDTRLRMLWKNAQMNENRRATED